MLDRTHKDRRRKLARKRNKRWRERLKHGEIIAPVTINAHRLGLLLRLHWLSERDADNRDRIGDAIAGLLDASE